MPYIIRVRAGRGATTEAEDLRKYKRDERYDRVQAIAILPPLDRSWRV